jgi:hypothetical protein
MIQLQQYQFQGIQQPPRATTNDLPLFPILVGTSIFV